MADWKATSARISHTYTNHEAFRDQTLTEVMRVIAVNHARENGPLRITLLALELYADGVVAQFLVVQQRGPIEAKRYGMPDFRAVAHDDAGTTYHDRSYGGSGSASRSGVAYWRMSHAFAPPVPTTAREIVIRIEDLAWREHKDGEMVETSRIAGPWEYAVRL